MMTTQEALKAAGAAARARMESNQTADGALFAQELNKADNSARAQMIEKLLKSLEAELPGGKASHNGDSVTIKTDGNTTIHLSSEMLTKMADDPDQYTKVTSLLEQLIEAGKDQQLVRAGGTDVRRSIIIDGDQVQYVEVQRTANGTQLASSMISIDSEGQDALANARQSGQSSTGFQGIFSTTSSWRFQSVLSNQGFTNATAASDEITAGSINGMSVEVIIQQWAASGQSGKIDVWSYMQMMGLCDPLVLDLGDEGFNLSSAEDGVYFDIKGDGSPVQTGFIQGNNAFLYLDQNGNGVVDNVSELFGDFGGYANGYENLKQYDDNGDGVIDENDAIYGNLRLWRDLNGDGINQADESISLAEAGVKSINLNYQKKYEADEHGNVIGERSTFERFDGTIGNSADVWLRNR